MRPMSIFLTMLLGCAPAGLGPSTAWAQSGCRGADSTSNEIVAYFQRLVSDSHSDYLNVRNSTGLPATSPSKVKLDTRTSACRSGAEAINAARQEPGTVRQVWLIKLDTWYAAVDPTIKVGPDEIVPYYLLDRQFGYVRTLVIQ